MESTLSPVRPRPTCNDVARLAGVSNATVSNVLNRYGAVSVSSRTRERVLKVASQLGYQRNRIAASLVRGQTQTIGVVIGSMQGSFHTTILQGIEKRCAAHGYRVMLLFANDPQPGIAQVRGLLEDCVAGLIVVGNFALSDISNWSEAASRQQTPLVLVDKPLAEKKTDYVCSDDYQGGLIATEHLLRLGHRHIAHFAGDLSVPTGVNRRDGYLAALQQAGLTPNEALMIGGEFYSEAFREAVMTLLNSPRPPTAVFAASDFHAAVALQVALERGLRVPGDLAVVGYGDTETGRSMALSTVSQDAEQMGAVAVERLLARLSNPALAPENLIVPTRLVVRRSCGAPVHKSPA